MRVFMWLAAATGLGLLMPSQPVSGFTYVGTVQTTATAAEGYLTASCIDMPNGFSYWSTNYKDGAADIIKLTIDRVAPVEAAKYSLADGSIKNGEAGWMGCVPGQAIYILYRGNDGTPPGSTLVKIPLPGFNSHTKYTLSPGDDYTSGVIDDTNAYIYLATDMDAAGDGYIMRVKLSDMSTSTIKIWTTASSIKPQFTTQRLVFHNNAVYLGAWVGGVNAENLPSTVWKLDTTTFTTGGFTKLWEGCQQVGSIAGDATNLYIGTYSKGGGDTDGIFKTAWPATSAPACTSNNLSPGIFDQQGFSYGVLLPHPAFNVIYGAGYCGQVYQLDLTTMQQGGPTDTYWTYTMTSTCDDTIITGVLDTLTTNCFWYGSYDKVPGGIYHFCAPSGPTPPPGPVGCTPNKLATASTSPGGKVAPYQSFTYTAMLVNSKAAQQTAFARRDRELQSVNAQSAQAQAAKAFPMPMVNASFAITLPAGVTLQTSAATPKLPTAVVYDNATGTLTWQLGHLKAGGKIKLSFKLMTKECTTPAPLALSGKFSYFTPTRLKTVDACLKKPLYVWTKNCPAIPKPGAKIPNPANGKTVVAACTCSVCQCVDKTCTCPSDCCTPI